MDFDQKFTVTMAAILCTCIVALVAIPVALCTYHTRKMAAMGYAETPVMGHVSTVWQRSNH